MNPPTTDAELTTRLHQLVKDILTYDHVHSWPLHDHERVHFVRRFVFVAREIHDSEPFLRAQVVETAAKAADLYKSPITMKPRAKRKTPRTK